MLNPVKQTSVIVHNDDWCVGEPPVRWDVSFGALVAEQIKRWFGKVESEKLRTIESPLRIDQPARKAA